MRNRATLVAALASTALSVLLAVAVNVGTGGTLPAPVGWLAPLAWPLVGVLAVVTVVLAVREAGRPAAATGPVATVPPTLPVPRELPPADSYTGRADDLHRLRALAARHRVIVLAGPPGIGKSALAVRLARELAERYPDGQVVAGLGGGSGIPAAPETVLARFLDAYGAGVSGPADLERLAAHHRSVLADRRVLLLLDDARDAAQVRPLLPGAPGCLTLVTSRSALADLGGSVTYDLEVLSCADALALLREAVGPRVDADPAAAAEVVAACGALPLALRLAGARLRGRPAWRVGDLAARLRDERARLDELQVGDRGVRASFATAYDGLTGPDRTAFRALGAYPGRELPAGAGAALAGDPGAVERLVDARLVDAVGADRYRLHDLMRLFARERLAAEDPPATAAAARQRLADWYAATLPAADATWIDAEVENVALAVRAALDAGEPAQALRLATAADVPLLHRAEQPVFLDICRDRLRAARDLDDDLAVDQALTRLGETANAYGQVEQGVALLTDAVRRWTAREDAGWLAHTRKGLGVALRDSGRFAEAAPHLEAARAHFAATGDRRQEAQTLIDIGIMLVTRHETSDAIEVLEQARALAAADMRPQEPAWAVLALATALHQAQRWDDARPLLEAARHGFRDPVNRTGEGYVLLELGDSADFNGDAATATRHYEDGRAAFARIDNRPGLAMADQALAHHHARHGNPADAAALFGRAAQRYEALGNRSNAGLNLLWRAEQQRLLGDRAGADVDEARGEALLEGSDLPQAGTIRARLREAGAAQPRRRPDSASPSSA